MREGHSTLAAGDFRMPPVPWEIPNLVPNSAVSPGRAPRSRPSATGQRQIVAELPGFARGLALCGPWAFFGLSKIRATSAMDGVPLAQRNRVGEIAWGHSTLASGDFRIRPVAFEDNRQSRTPN